jgi:2-keto-3-deoxy-L-fuconate dehydrogenase
VAADFIKRGIRVNAICSSTIESPSLGERVNEVSTKTGTPISEVAQCFTDRQTYGPPRATRGKSQRWRSF